MKFNKPAMLTKGAKFLMSTTLLSTLVIFSQCKKEDDVMPQSETSTVMDTPASETDKGTSTDSPTPTGRIAYVIKATEQVVDGAKLDLEPGCIITLEAGTRGPLLIKNIKGTANAPITIKNDGGVCTIKATSAYGLKTDGCEYFRLTGVSSSGQEKGIVVDGGQIGITFDRFSSDVELDNVEVKNCGFAGVMAKTDPSCELAANYSGFVMKNLKFHDNNIHDVKGEGFYVGNSFFFEGRDLDCGKIKPHEIHNVDIYSNSIYNSGCEAIQAGCVTQGLKIHHNKVENFGISPFADAQDNGVQIGEGSSGEMYMNTVMNGPGNGIIVLGQGNTKVYNNLVVNPGTHGAFIDNRGQASGDVAFVNNTFVNVKEGGIKSYNELVNNKFYNNIIVGSGEAFAYSNGATGDEQNNLTVATIEEAGFENANAGNYKLTATSPAVDKGMEAGVISDLANKARPSGNATDIGAYEF